MEVFASQGAPQVSTAPVAIHISADLTSVSMTLAVNFATDVSDCLYLNVNLKKNCIYLWTLRPKIFKTFLIDDFCHLPPFDTGGAPWAVKCECLRKFSKNLKQRYWNYQSVGVICEKNPKLRISWHCPFKRCFWV